MVGVGGGREGRRGMYSSWVGGVPDELGRPMCCLASIGAAYLVE